MDSCVACAESLYPNMANTHDFPTLLHRHVSEIEVFLAQEQYVHRLIFKEGEEVDGLLTLRHFHTPRSADDKRLLDDTKLSQEPWVLLLGNQGSGKSLVLKFSFVDAANRFLKDGMSPIPLFLDLDSDLGSDLDLAKALDHRYEGAFSGLATQHPAGYSLFLDSLDERLLREEHRFVKDLEMFISTRGEHLTGCITACRRAIWQTDWFQQGATKLVPYHVDHLGHETYEQILPDREIRHQFFQQCHGLGIDALLETPFDGFYLARLFAAGQPLPRTRRECLDKRIRESLLGTDRDRATGVSPPVHRLRFLASQLACVATFSRSPAWSAPDALDALGESTVLREHEPATHAEMVYLLQRPLFRRDGNRFKFSHTLYQEFLAAEALNKLSLRKQRQLLKANLTGTEHVSTPYRGIAAFLAEQSPEFFEHLLKSDPLVSFFAEAPGLSRDREEALLRSVFDTEIAQQHPPWYEMSPSGVRPESVLSKHRPDNIYTFLLPYLENADEFSRLWATSAADKWGGDVQLNPSLGKIAQDSSQHSHARCWAIQAIGHTRNLEAIRALYNLFDDADDQVRGYAIKVYRLTERPSPGELLAKFNGGARDHNFYGTLKDEARYFGLTLNAEELKEAGMAIEKDFSAFGDLRDLILAGLFERAAELHSTDIPPGVIVRLWCDHNASTPYFDDELERLLRQEGQIVQALWNHIMELLKVKTAGVYPFEMAQHIAPYCDDVFFNLLQPSREGMTPEQETFIIDVLQLCFSREPTIERLDVFRERIPAFAHHLQIPRDKRKLRPLDPLEERHKIVDALSGGGSNPISQTGRVLSLMMPLPHHHRLTGIGDEEIYARLERLFPVLRLRVIRAFRDFVAKQNYIRSSTYVWWLEIPFWVLHRLGDRFDAKKIAEFARCFAFRYSDRERNRRYKDLLEELRHLDRKVWETCVYEIVDEAESGIYDAINYLIEIKDPLYLARCRERLSNGFFDRFALGDLLRYWAAFCPTDCNDVLRSLYVTIRDAFAELARTKEAGKLAGSRGDSLPDLAEYERWRQFEPLFFLMAEDDDYGWQEFKTRLQKEDVPMPQDFHYLHVPRLPANAHRLSILADWYAYCERKAQGDPSAGREAYNILGAIISSGGEAAITELRRLQGDKAFPGSEWLGYSISKIEDRMLAEANPAVPCGQLLDFVNKSRLALVQTERDLFEWLCEVFDEVKNAVEKRGEGVDGFWNGDLPKDEPSCQNVLWPRLEPKLQELGLVGIEEKLMGIHWCDFWVVMPRRGEPPLQVAVELKTARKGYGRTNIIEPVENQLWTKYMQPAVCRHGIFVVLWFRDRSRYDFPRVWTNIEELTTELAARTNRVAKTHGVVLKSYVINLTAPHRMH